MPKIKRILKNVFALSLVASLLNPFGSVEGSAIKYIRLVEGKEKWRPLLENEGQPITPIIVDNKYYKGLTVKDISEVKGEAKGEEMAVYIIKGRDLSALGDDKEEIAEYREVLPPLVKAKKVMESLENIIELQRDIGRSKGRPKKQSIARKGLEKGLEYGPTIASVLLAEKYAILSVAIPIVAEAIEYFLKDKDNGLKEGFVETIDKKLEELYLELLAVKRIAEKHTGPKPWTKEEAEETYEKFVKSVIGAETYLAFREIVYDRDLKEIEKIAGKLRNQGFVDRVLDEILGEQNPFSYKRSTIEHLLKDCKEAIDLDKELKDIACISATKFIETEKSANPREESSQTKFMYALKEAKEIEAKRNAKIIARIKIEGTGIFTPSTPDTRKIPISFRLPSPFGSIEFNPDHPESGEYPPLYPCVLDIRHIEFDLLNFKDETDNFPSTLSGLIRKNIITNTNYLICPEVGLQIKNKGKRIESEKDIDFAYFPYKDNTEKRFIISDKITNHPMGTFKDGSGKIIARYLIQIGTEIGPVSRAILEIEQSALNNGRQEELDKKLGLKLSQIISQNYDKIFETRYTISD